MEREMLGIGIINLNGRVVATVIFDGDEDVNLEPDEIMDLIRNGKISVKNIDMFEALREEFLAYFPLKIK